MKNRLSPGWKPSSSFENLSLLLSLDFLLSLFQLGRSLLLNLRFRVPSYIIHWPFWLLTEMNLHLCLACIFVFLWCHYRIFGRLYDYCSLRLWGQILHDFSEVAESQEVQLPVLDEIVLDPFLQVLYFWRQFELFSLKRLNLWVEIANLATYFRILRPSNPTKFVFVNFLNIPNSF